jgi:hypothetical protein
MLHLLQRADGALVAYLSQCEDGRVAHVCPLVYQ